MIMCTKKKCLQHSLRGKCFHYSFAPETKPKLWRSKWNQAHSHHNSYCKCWEKINLKGQQCWRTLNYFHFGHFLRWQIRNTPFTTFNGIFVTITLMHRIRHCFRLWTCSTFNQLKDGDEHIRQFSVTFSYRILVLVQRFEMVLFGFGWHLNWVYASDSFHHSIKLPFRRNANCFEMSDLLFSNNVSYTFHWWWDADYHWTNHSSDGKFEHRNKMFRVWSADT